RSRALSSTAAIWSPARRSRRFSPRPSGALRQWRRAKSATPDDLRLLAPALRRVEPVDRLPALHLVVDGVVLAPSSFHAGVLEGAVFLGTGADRGLHVAAGAAALAGGGVPSQFVDQFVVGVGLALGHVVPPCPDQRA